MNSPTVFITGAAAGIGRATALLFAAQGYRVGAYDIDELGLSRLAADITAAGGTVQTGVLDVTKDTQWSERLAEFHAATGRLDILINNAGILRSGAFEDIEIAVHRAIIEVNVVGLLAGTHAAFPYLRDTPGAQVVNLCSGSAIYGQPDLASYGASKSAVKSLTEALDLEWERHDIRVIAVWPMFVATGMVEGMDIGTTQSMGVHLTAADVATGIWNAVRKRSRLPKVHYEIGAQARLLVAAGKIAPAWATRMTNKYLAKR
ncbi:SDR family oxidoreductase [Nocardia sp. NPDC048505]|uniref:SDR family oxidoreductase n=1 Tax=unclassified Nocardia TaxID=2637762 RepID=UPI0034091E48